MISRHRHIKFLAATALVSSLALTSGSFAGQSGDIPTPKENEIVNLMRSAKVIDPKYKLTVNVSDEQILITTQKKAKASDAELKIQAVLLSKIAFDAIASGPQRAQLMFLDFDTNGYSEVPVKRAEVLLFGEGKLSQKELLASLEVKTSQALEETTGSTSVVAGPLEPERLMALERINRLSKRGTNVVLFKKLFDEVESAAKQNQKDEVRKQLADLNGHLKEQEDVLKALEERKRAPLPRSSPARAAHKVATTTVANDSASEGATDEKGERVKQLYNLWQNFSENFTAKYPQDMQDTVARVRFQMTDLNEHGIVPFNQWLRLGIVRDLVQKGKVDEARTVLNDVAAKTEEAYRRMKQQQALPHQR